MKTTLHARQRWQQRFPHLDIYTEWASAGRVGKKTRRKLAKQCPAHAEEFKKWRGKYYRLGKNNVVFVVVPPETIITVYPLEEHND